MPHKIVFYSDELLKVPHDGNLKRVGKDRTAEATIHCRNEGDGTLLDPVFRIVKSVDASVNAEIVSKTPKELAPGEKCAVTIRYVGDGKWGWRKAYLDVEGEHAD